MDIHAIHTFIDEGFFNNNIPTYVDVNHIIDFYKTNIITNRNIYPASVIKILSDKILKIRISCIEIVTLYELVFNSLIIYYGTLDNRESFEANYAQWVYSRWLLSKINKNEEITTNYIDTLFNTSQIINTMTSEMEELYTSRHLFIQLWNMTTENILESRSNFEKALVKLLIDYNTSDSTFTNNILLYPYDTLPFWYIQPAFGLSYHNSNNALYFTLLGKFYTSLLKLRYPLIDCNISIAKTSEKQSKKQMKVGFIGRIFQNHSIGRITMGLIEKLYEFSDIETVVYSLPLNTDRNDTFEKRIHKASKHFRPILTENFIDVVNQIRKDELDILIIPDMLTDIYIYCIGLYRLAPVQITTWGHPDTSGSSNIDYYVSSKLFEKLQDNLYSEKLICMNSSSVYYYNLQNTHGFDPIQLFKNTCREDLLRDIGITNIPKKAHVYGILSSMYKMDPSFDAIINAILHYDQNAYIIIIKGVHEELFNRVIDRFNITLNNIYLQRICVCNYQTQSYGYEKLILSCDVILDTSPFGGFISTFDAFSCNKSVVTMPGNKLYGRITQGLYKQMGFEDLIVNNQEAYIELAIKIATYPPIKRSFENKIALNKDKLYENKESIQEWYDLIKTLISK
jgi:predicted O-linked N-acetylglucosamine transferase (SPINDLY family)